MEVASALRAIRRRWVTVGVCTWVAAVLALALNLLATPMYTATTEGLVTIGNPQSRPPYSLSNGSQYILNRLTSYAQLGTTPMVLEPVVSDLSLRESAAELAGDVSAQTVVNDAVLVVHVVDRDPEAAARIADSTLHHLGSTIEGLEAGNVTVAPLGPASTPTAPDNKNVVLMTALGAFGGLIVGLFAVVCSAMLKSRRVSHDA